MRERRRATALITAAIISIVGYGIAGNLTPPGPPAPTMKTLDQVKPGTPIQSLASAPPYGISTSGVYYLTGNITGVSGQHGIVIYAPAASDVTIDLGGFKLAGVSGSVNAIYVNGTGTRVTIRNGVITGWGGSGIAAANATVTVADVTVSACNQNGIYAGASSRVENCSVSACNQDGIYVGDSSRVENCSVTGCTVTTLFTGIETGMGSIVRGCVIRGLTGTSACFGISVPHSCIVEGNTVSGISGQDGSLGITVAANCSVMSNTVSEIAATRSEAVGINCCCPGTRIVGNTCRSITSGEKSYGMFLPGGNALISDNVCSNCTSTGSSGIAAGIYLLGSNAIVRGNACNDFSANGIMGFATAGIYATGDRVRIENNQCCSSLTGSAAAASGIRIGTGTGCVIRANTTSSNQTAGIYFEGTSPSGNYCAENVTHDATGINNVGSNTVGSGDRANVSF